MTEHDMEKLIDLAGSLCRIMADETAQLARTARLPDHVALGRAKQALVGQLDAELARIERENGVPMRPITLPPSHKLRDAFSELSRVAAENAAVLKRHLELSEELLDALTAEARRASGHGGIAYRATGKIASSKGNGPIAVSTAL